MAIDRVMHLVKQRDANLSPAINRIVYLSQQATIAYLTTQDIFNDLVIETGRDEVSYAHTVDSPIEVSTGQNENGETVAIWINDATGTKTLIKLPAN